MKKKSVNQLNNKRAMDNCYSRSVNAEPKLPQITVDYTHHKDKIQI